MAKDDWLTSPGGPYRLVLQPDGNLVVYDLWNGHHPIWASDTSDEAVDVAILQDDGDFVIYGCPDAVWTTDTDGHGRCSLTIQDDGNLVINPLTEPAWASQ